ncbi:MAG: tetratricopeptide repeat protein [Candidatus Edwardsbacteria bacterium]|nr:tetratricopeptide repeat protein [Candidatus Edwardsbacteria bacterium]
MSMDDVTRFTTVLEQNPEDIPSYLGRAAAYAEQGYFQQAIEDYDRAVGLINKLKAGALMAAGDLQGALDIFTQAIALNPNDALSYLSRGIALSSMGNNQQAVEDFNAALSLNPNDPAVYHNRGIAFSASGDYAQAIADYDASLSLYPNDPMVYYNKGIAFKLAGDYQQFVEAFKIAAQMGFDQAQKFLADAGIPY